MNHDGSRDATSLRVVRPTIVGTPVKTLEDVA